MKTLRQIIEEANKALADNLELVKSRTKDDKRKGELVTIWEVSNYIKGTYASAVCEDGKSASLINGKIRLTFKRKKIVVPDTRYSFGTETKMVIASLVVDHIVSYLNLDMTVAEAEDAIAMREAEMKARDAKEKNNKLESILALAEKVNGSDLLDALQAFKNMGYDEQQRVRHELEGKHL